MSSPEHLPGLPGAYLLLLDLAGPVALPPTLGAGDLPAGRYCYVGSAQGPGGLRARCARHLRGAAKLRWHVDRLTVRARQLHAMAFPGAQECALVDALLARADTCVPVPGFGSSDCARCPAHLVGLEPL